MRAAFALTYCYIQATYHSDIEKIYITVGNVSVSGRVRYRVIYYRYCALEMGGWEDKISSTQNNCTAESHY